MDYNIFPTSTGNLFHGHVPSAYDLARLKDLGVTAIWNLGRELVEELEVERDLFKIVVHSDIVDFSIPELPNKFLDEVKMICQYLKDGQSVFVHCMGGRGRTGMALASVCAMLDNIDVDKALTLAKVNCGGPERTHQVEFVRKLFR